MKRVLGILAQYLVVVMILSPLIFAIRYGLVHYVPTIWMMYEKMPPAPAGLMFAVAFWGAFYTNGYVWAGLICAFGGFELLYRFPGKTAVRLSALALLTLFNAVVLGSMFVFLFAAGSVQMVQRSEEHLAEKSKIRSEQNAPYSPPADGWLNGERGVGARR